MTIFGNIKTAGAVEGAVLGIVQKWLPTYVAELERQTGRAVPSVARPRSYGVTYDLDNWPENQLPAILVVAAGTDGEPEEEGGGVFSAWWSVGVSAVLTAPDAVNVKRNSQLYAAAIRALVVQHRNLGGFAMTTDWVAEEFAESTADQNRSLAITLNSFRVKVRDVVTSYAGPIQPDPKPDPNEPYPEWTTVTSTETVANRADEELP